MNKRIFVRKKEDYNVEESTLKREFKTNLNINNLETIERYNIYDIFNINEDVLEQAKTTVFSEPVTDDVYDNIDLQDKMFLAVENLPNQFDMRAESANECLRLINPETNATTKSAELLIFSGIDEQDLKKIEEYYINKIECRKKDLNSLDIDYVKHDMTEIIIENFIKMNEEQLQAVQQQYGFSFSFANLQYIQSYFIKENRDPLLGELQIIDTYWSDHCRHTTFNTVLENIKIKDKEISKTYQDYLTKKREINDTKPISLMNLGTICGKYAVKKGYLTNLEATEEDNAISIEVTEEDETYLLQFKNETHNHPTEIEPYGGASTCIGGAIRDPLSGRAYVYQGMRISGAANVFETIDQTLPGKLPQRIISKKATDGFSSYGNQIGLATTFVKEIYHPGYKAKHLEAGAVVGAVNKKFVTRKQPEKGDIVLLIGGRTGFDGIGGATGSSKSHNEKSIEDAAVEVQKGNAPVERKIQRLFMNPEAIKLIKKSNDFGAGGVSVAIGELSDSIEIYLDKIPLKVSKLKATEIALSESQERMAVVLAPEDELMFRDYAKLENLEVSKVATVTDTNHLVMKYDEEQIINLNRDFLNSSGKINFQDVEISAQKPVNLNYESDLKKLYENPNLVDNLNMDTMFDATVGATTVLMPYGGKYQLTKNQVSVQKIPMARELTSAISYGYNPILMSENQYFGAMAAVVDSVTKLIASGIELRNINLSFQEYFMRLNDDPKRFGTVMATLLGAYRAQMGLECPALGGKDSMSGTYEEMDVPPTLISFAFAPGKINQVISTEIKAANENIYFLPSEIKENDFDFAELKLNYQNYNQLVKKGQVTAAAAISEGGIALQLSKMLMGNKLGCKIETELDMYQDCYGSIIFTSPEELPYLKLGQVINEECLHINNDNYDLNELIDANLNYFASVYPNLKAEKVINELNQAQKLIDYCPQAKRVPQVFIPVFSGTNSEIEMTRAFTDAGAKCDVWVFRNLTEKDINESIKAMIKKIKEADIIAFSGGFSGGDEPDGSGKYIVNILANAEIKKAIEQHLAENKLILGICNGFQALIKSGLITDSKVNISADNPTLFRNDCNYHISKVVTTKLETNSSPWLNELEIGSHYSQVISHGEGKLTGNPEVIEQLIARGQVAFTYVDENPNGSEMAIEGLISPCGKILGKMAHSERYQTGLYQNISGTKKLSIFENAVKYFQEGEK